MSTRRHTEFIGGGWRVPVDDGQVPEGRVLHLPAANRWSYWTEGASGWERTYELACRAVETVIRRRREREAVEAQRGDS
ncbi:MAG TPA: hypothetical protein VK841_09530 [Polyangiaceae bacterium]|jgi:hypothetical protein|nr:hypothetical protein [Polyangiaceae bacterium]